MPQAIARALLGLAAAVLVAGCGGQEPSAGRVALRTGQVVEFSRGGEASPVVAALERVVGEGRAQVALAPLDGGRWVVVLVDGPQRHYDLDAGVRTEEFPILAEQGFQPAPAPIARQLSLYRAVAKRALGYEAGRDRLIVLTCPRADWPRLRGVWLPRE